MKKRIFMFFTTLILIASMAVSAHAVTPKFEYKAIKIPEIKVSVKIADSVFDDWFKEHHIKINYTNIKLV